MMELKLREMASSNRRTRDEEEEEEVIVISEAAMALVVAPIEQVTQITKESHDHLSVRGVSNH